MHWKESCKETWCFKDDTLKGTLVTFSYKDDPPRGTMQGIFVADRKVKDDALKRKLQEDLSLHGRCKANCRMDDTTHFKPVAQGQYLVSDTSFPHLHDWVFGREEARQRPRRGRSPVEHSRTFVCPTKESWWEAKESWLGVGITVRGLTWLNCCLGGMFSVWDR